MTIKTTSDKSDGSYVRVTRSMMKQFGVETEYDGKNYYVIVKSRYKNLEYPIEPDMSAACYFYAMAALTGGEIIVRGVNNGLIQGDIKFFNVLQKLGCELKVTEYGTQVTGPKNGSYSGVDVDMNDYSDQTMTLACLAAFANSPTIIRNVYHIRFQECDRLQGIVNELTKVGISCYADGKDIYIHPGIVEAATIETYEDHRFAMAFTLLGLRVEGIVINDPLCCMKTFENYFVVLEDYLMIMMIICELISDGLGAYLNLRTKLKGVFLLVLPY